MWTIGVEFLKRLPWGKIIAILAALAAVLAILKYIQGAEQSKADLKSLTAAYDVLEATNAENEAYYLKQIEILGQSVKRERKREEDYANNIKIIQSGPNGDCGRNSPAIFNSLRLRRERIPNQN